MTVSNMKICYTILDVTTPLSIDVHQSIISDEMLTETGVILKR